MRVTIADLFDAYRRAWNEHRRLRITTEEDFDEVIQKRDEITKVILALARVFEDCRHEVDLLPEDHRVITPFFSKI